MSSGQGHLWRPVTYWNTSLASSRWSIHLDNNDDGWIRLWLSGRLLAGLPQDLTAIGVTQPGVRKRLTSEISKLCIGDGIPPLVPVRCPFSAHSCVALVCHFLSSQDVPVTGIFCSSIHNRLLHQWIYSRRLVRDFSEIRDVFYCTKTSLSCISDFGTFLGGGFH